MANSYTWKINHLDTKLVDGDLQKVVKSCRWSVDATDNEESATTASTFGYADFDSPEAGAFVAYDDLTEEEVLNWVWAKVDKTTVENGLAGTIEEKKAPEVTILRNPWLPPVPSNPNPNSSGSQDAAFPE